MKKWVCSVCGYVFEGENPPEKCPQCGVPGSKFTEQKGEMTWAAEHVIGVGKSFGADVPADVQEKIVDGLRANFTGECTEVGMYLAMGKNNSIDAPDAQIQSFGSYKIVLFLGLPGEDNTYTIQISSDKFESTGLIIMASVAQEATPSASAKSASALPDAPEGSLSRTLRALYSRVNIS